MNRIDYEKRRLALREKLKAARKAAGLTQAQVAARLGKPQSFVAKYETGERRLEAVELPEIAEIFAVDLRILVYSLDIVRSGSASDDC